ncbi:MAG: DUF3592 domain-containing protein [Geobacter sp.]|nr:DUF3592 domain-containing protein [Geobacter sp.]
MWLFYLMFLLPIILLTLRVILVLWSSLWSSTEGTVLDFQCKTRIFMSKFPSLQDDVVKKYVKVRYQYSVNEEIYQSKRVSLDFGSRLFEEEEFDSDDLIKSIKNGRVRVEYLNSYPRLSVLQRTKDDTAASLCIIFVLLIVMSISMFCIYVVLAPK